MKNRRIEIPAATSPRGTVAWWERTIYDAQENPDKAKAIVDVLNEICNPSEGSWERLIAARDRDVKSDSVWNFFAWLRMAVAEPMESLVRMKEWGDFLEEEVPGTPWSDLDQDRVEKWIETGEGVRPF